MGRGGLAEGVEIERSRREAKRPKASRMRTTNNRGGVNLREKES